MRTPESQGALPWYRHFHVWLLIAFPAISVAGGLAMLAVAIQTDDGLVADDYYREGMQINRRMERDRRAVTVGLGADLEFDSSRRRVRVTLRAHQGFHAPARLQMSFMHPTRAGMDALLTLDAVSPMIYEGPLPELDGVRWYVLIEADDWRLLETVDRR